jgi:sulfide:quinone oxidoreductase
MIDTTFEPARVLIAGAGIAGIEAALALRAFAGPAAEVRLVDPGSRFTIPATATGRAFGVGTGIDLRLADVVARAGGTLVPGRLTAVDPARRLVMLAGGRLLTYDSLVVAIGARLEPSVHGALRFAGHADVTAVRAMVDEIAQASSRGAAIRLAIVVPLGCSWPLAAYELALMTREHLTAEGCGDAVEISVVTAEDTPLTLFGPQASAAVERSLGRAGVSVQAGAIVREWGWGQLELVDGRTLEADRVIALPVQRGPSLDGLPTDTQGFVRIATDGSVPGAPGVWAVGDSTSFPLRQGGIACQQADSVAAAIARELGADTEELPFHPTLRGWMWDGGSGTFLRGEPSGGRTESSGVAVRTPLWWPAAKVAGRYLTPFLHGWPAGSALADHPRAASLVG